MSCLYRDYRRVEGFEDYIVSNYGEVWSLKFGKCLLKKMVFNHHGYKMMKLSKNGKAKHFTVHVLVGNAFIGKRTNRLEFDHIDRDKTNNRADNIRLATRSEQIINTKIRKNNKLKQKNIFIANNSYRIKIIRDKKVVFEKNLNVKKYSLNDAIKIRDDFLTSSAEC